MKSGDVKMAATLFVLIGEETAAEVFRYLNEAEIETISREISSVGPLAAEEAEKAAEELYASLVTNKDVSEGGMDYAKKVILRTLGAGPARRLLDRLSSDYVASNTFEAIERLSPVQLSQFIQNEHPQTIALILAHLKSANSAELLESLPEDLQADVAVRMASLDTISEDVLKGISSVLEEKLKPVGTLAHNQVYGGIRAVAELLNRMDRRRSRIVLEKIDEDRPEVANSIRELMFVFDDITTLDDMSVREVLQRIDKKTVAQALKGATDAQQNQFYRNMSGRAVEMMKEEIDLLGPQKIKDVHAAQQRIVEIVRRLEEDGVINLAPGGGDEYVV
jgi:flagellar motor switch protein FliG